MAGFEVWLYSPDCRDRVRVRVEVPGWDAVGMRLFARRKYRRMRRSHRPLTPVTARAAVIAGLVTVFDQAVVSTVPARTASKEVA